jgi:pantetheine-phosphate adenylyltransferase
MPRPARTAVYPGTFDPVTLGHLDVLRRASRLFDRVIVAVAPSDSKGPWFTVEERPSMAREACKGIRNVKVLELKGLTVRSPTATRPPPSSAASANSAISSSNSTWPMPTA